MVIVTFTLTVIFSGFYSIDRILWGAEYALLFKMLASVSFLITLILAYQKGKGDKKFFNIMLLGFVFSVLGDLFLGMHFSLDFVLGILSFAIAQAMFIAAFIYLVKINSIDILLFAVFTGITVFLEFVIKGLDYEGLLPLVVIYTILIAAMLSKSISLLRIRSQSTTGVAMLVTGMVLFYASDVVLMFSIFLENADKSLAYINTLLYFLGQGLVGLSFIFPLKKLDNINKI